MIGLDLEIGQSELRAHTSSVKASLAQIEFRSGIEAAVKCAMMNAIGHLEWLVEQMADQTATAIIDEIRSQIVQHEEDVTADEAADSTIN